MTFKAFNLKKLLQALLYILAPLVLGFAVSMAIGNTDDFYFSLNRPPLSPPPIVFPIVWSILYLLMGFASYLSRNWFRSMVLFYIGLFMNLAWIVFFFGLHLVGFSAVWIALLLIESVYTLRSFFECNKLSGWLFLPYVLWLVFAVYLNIGILLLN